MPSTKPPSLRFLVQAVDIDGMFALAASALQAVRTAAEKRGLTLNMQAGKTELLCAIVGAGAHQAQIPLADQNHLMPVNLSDHSHSLRVVQTYRHLGGWGPCCMLMLNLAMQYVTALPLLDRHGDPWSDLSSVRRR